MTTYNDASKNPMYYDYDFRYADLSEEDELMHILDHKQQHIDSLFAPSAVDPVTRPVGNCSPITSYLFFSTLSDDIENAKLLCSTCEIKADCLRGALAAPWLEGVWGGLTRSERLTIINRHPSRTHKKIK